MDTTMNRLEYAELHLDDVYVWHQVATQIGERYELSWQPSDSRLCQGVVMREGPYFDAYIEVLDSAQTSVHWAPSQFPTAGEARVWVQNQMVRCE